MTTTNTLETQAVIKTIAQKMILHIYIIYNIYNIVYTIYNN